MRCHSGLHGSKQGVFDVQSFGNAFLDEGDIVDGLCRVLIKINRGLVGPRNNHAQFTQHGPCTINIALQGVAGAWLRVIGVDRHAPRQKQGCPTCTNRSCPDDSNAVQRLWRRIGHSALLSLDQKFTRSPPFKPNRLRASCGVATVRDRSSTMRRIFLT